MNGFNIEVAELVEDDGFRTIHPRVHRPGRYRISGEVTLEPLDAPPEPEPPRWPDATTTGVSGPTRLVTAPVHPGDSIAGTTYTVNTPAAVYQGLEFHHLVVVRAPGAVFTDCRFSGLDAVPPASTALFSVRDDRPANTPVPSATLTRCTLRPRRIGVLHDAIRGSNITVRRCDISGVVDGLHIFGSTAVADPWAGNVLVEDTFMHDFIVVRDPGRPSGYSHNDAIQVVGGSNIVIRDSDLGSARMASLMVVPTRNNCSDITIEGCLIGESEAGINISDTRNPSGPLRGLTIRGNTFHHQPIPMIASARTLDQASPAIVGNEWDDGATPGPTVRRGA